jgi:hypothetical protein
MKSALLALLLLVAQAVGQAIAQCPPGAKSCPMQAPSKSAPAYVFRTASGNSTPWSTAVRISITLGQSKQVGSGTVIDSDPSSTLVMTAAHVLRAPAGSPIIVEVFAGTIDRKTGSLGSPIGSYPGEAIDRDDALDVGLLRFRPGKVLAASPLVPQGWSAGSEPLCSVGCSHGDDPTAVSERFLAEQTLGNSDGGSYRGLECDRRPPQGRSGGGLFDQDGRLAGVCDFAETVVPRGLYAHPESLRSILKRNGLVELAEGTSRKMPPPSPGVSPFQPPDPQPAPVVPTPPPSLAAEAREVGDYLWPILAGVGGIGGTSIVAVIFAAMRRPTPTAPAFVPDPESLVGLLRKSLEEADRKKARKAADDELLEKVRALLAEQAPNE